MPITKSVRFEKCFNLGNYEHEKIAVEIEVESGDNVQDIITKARNYVNLQSQPFQSKIAQAQDVVNNPDDHTGREIETAKRFLKSCGLDNLPEISHLSESRE
jgi:hypothetical protein